MFTLLQSVILIVLRNGGLGLNKLMTKVTVPVTKTGLKRTLTILQGGGLVIKTKRTFMLTQAGQDFMRSRGAEHEASRKLKKK